MKESLKEKIDKIKCVSGSAFSSSKDPFSF